MKSAQVDQSLTDIRTENIFDWSFLKDYYDLTDVEPPKKSQRQESKDFLKQSNEDIVHRFRDIFGTLVSYCSTNKNLQNKIQSLDVLENVYKMRTNFYQQIAGSTRRDIETIVFIK